MPTALTEEILYCVTPRELEMALAPWLLLPPTRLGFDLETTGLNPHEGKILLVQLSDGIRTVVAHAPRIGSYELSKLLVLLNKTQLVGHNLKFEYQWVRVHWDQPLQNLFCTQLTEQILTAGLKLYADRPHLKDLTQKYLMKSLNKGLQKSFIDADPATFDPTDEQIEYAALDAQIVIPLANVLWRKVQEEQLENTFKLEMLTLPVLSEMELNGCKIDVPAWKDMLTRATARFQEEEAQLQELMAGALALYKGRVRAVAMQDINSWTELSEAYQADLENRADMEQDWDSRLQRRRWIQAHYKLWKEEHKKPVIPAICADGPINLGSWQQVLLALHELGIMVPDTKYSTLLRAREQYPEHKDLFISYAAWKGLEKLISSFGQALLEKVDHRDRLHPEINQLVDTGRTSERKPNLQQIPSGNKKTPVQELQQEVRKCFIAEPGYLLISADYSAIEFRIGAELHHQPEIIAALKSGEDVHKKTASLMMHKPVSEVDPLERYTAKTLNYGIMYQGGVAAMAQQLGSEDLAQVKQDMKAWAQAYPNMAHGLRQDGELALERGYAVTRNGRKRYFQLPKVPYKNEQEDPEAWRVYRSLQSQIKRRGANHPIQGASADITKLALVRLAKRFEELELDAQLVNVIHDEIVVEAREEDAEYVASLMVQEMIEAGQQWFKEVPIEVEYKIGKQWLH